MATYEELMQGARKAHAAGDAAAAKRFLELAKQAKNPAMAELSGAFQQAVTPRAPDAPDAYQPSSALHSAIGGGLQGLTFGLGDELAARVASMHPGITYDEALPFFRKDLEKSRQDHPYVTTGAEIAGAVAAPVGAIASGGSLPLRMAKSAATTGALSGMYGFNAGEGGFQNRVENALPQAGMGALIGGAIPVGGWALQKLLQGNLERATVKAASKNGPAASELRGLGQSAYKEVDDAGVQIAPQAFDRARGTILDDLQNNTGFDQHPGGLSLTPHSARVMDIMAEDSARMATDPTAALPFKSLDQLRRKAGAAAGNVTNKSDQASGMSIINGLDDFVQNLDPQDVVAGDVEALKTALPKAREIWTKLTKTQLIEDAIAKGETNFMSGPSSGIRNEFAKILRNPKLRKKFSDVEIRALSRVINGGNGLERLALLAGGGIGQISQVAMGSSLGPLGTILGAGAAYGSRKLAEVLTAKEADMVRGLMANGGLKSVPQAPTALRDLIEQRLRLGTAASLQPR